MSTVGPDVVVVGGGVVGLSVALALRQGGVDHVTLVERDPSYARASSALALGAVRQLFMSTATVALARRSIELYRLLDARLAAAGLADRVAFRQVGTLVLATQASRPRIERRATQLMAAGAGLAWVDGAALRHRLPGLNLDDVVGGYFSTDDGVLEARALVTALGMLCDREGVARVRAELTGIAVEDGRVAGAELDGARRLTCPVVVCAAGAFSAAVGRMAGLDVPVVPVRQQLTRVELPAGERYDLPMVVTPQGIFWRYEAPPQPRAAPRVVCGYVNRAESPGERFDYDADVWLLELAPVLARYMPSYRRARPLGGWAGLYEMTPDGLPLVGEHPQLPGFWLACGFSGHGIMLAPAVAEALAAVMVGRRPALDLSAFNPGRLTAGTVTPADPLV